MYGTPQFGRLRGMGTYGTRAPFARRFSRGGLLSAITADQAAQQAMPLNTIRNTAGFTQTVYNDIEQAAASGNFTAFNPSGCAGITPSGATLSAATGVSGGVLLKFAGATGPAAPIVAGIGGALEIFSAIFSNHAAKVKQEQQVVCAAVPAASDSIAAITQAVQNGTITPQAGIASLQQLQSSFQSTVAGIVKNNSSQCNAACVWTKMLTAIVAELSSQFQDLAQQAAANPVSAAVSSNPITAPLAPVVNTLAPIANSIVPTVSNAYQSVQTVAASAGLPAWLLPLGIFALLWKIL